VLYLLAKKGLSLLGERQPPFVSKTGREVLERRGGILGERNLCYDTSSIETRRGFLKNRGHSTLQECLHFMERRIPFPEPGHIHIPCPRGWGYSSINNTCLTCFFYRVVTVVAEVE